MNRGPATKTRQLPVAFGGLTGLFSYMAGNQAVQKGCFFVDSVSVSEGNQSALQ